MARCCVSPRLTANPDGLNDARRSAHPQLLASATLTDFERSISGAPAAHSRATVSVQATWCALTALRSHCAVLLLQQNQQTMKGAKHTMKGLLQVQRPA
jgi:hypothetical protein